MTQPQTYLSRDFRKAWRAETKIKFGEGWQLDLTTRKNDNGEIVTSASVARVEGGFATHRMFADYSRNVFRITARCTEKVIRERHAIAIDMLDTIIADVRSHYIDRDEPLPAAPAEFAA
jgi:hypothetical protein